MQPSFFSKISHFPRVFGSFLERRIPGKNGEVTPRKKIGKPKGGFWSIRLGPGRFRNEIPGVLPWSACSRRRTSVSRKPALGVGYPTGRLADSVSNHITSNNMGVNFNEGPSGGHHLDGDLFPPTIWEGPLKFIAISLLVSRPTVWFPFKSRPGAVLARAIGRE